MKRMKQDFTDDALLSDAEPQTAPLSKDRLAAIRNELPEEDMLCDLAELYKLFGDSTRVKILCALFESELRVCDIAEVLGMGQSAISHQLRLLKGAKLVKARRDGKTVCYSLSDDHVRTIIGMGMDHLCE